MRLADCHTDRPSETDPYISAVLTTNEMVPVSLQENVFSWLPAPSTNLTALDVLEKRGEAWINGRHTERDFACSTPYRLRKLSAGAAGYRLLLRVSSDPAGLHTHHPCVPTVLRLDRMAELDPIRVNDCMAEVATELRWRTGIPERAKDEHRADRPLRRNGVRGGIVCTLVASHQIIVRTYSFPCGWFPRELFWSLSDRLRRIALQDPLLIVSPDHPDYEISL